MAQAIDYNALAKQAGAISSTPAPSGKIDYDALAKQAGAISSVPAPSADIDYSNVAGAGPQGVPTPAAHAAPYAAMQGKPEVLPSTGDKVLGNNPISDTVGNVWNHAKNLVAAPVQAFTAAPSNDVETGIQGAASNTGGVLGGKLALGAYRMLAEPTVNAVQDSIALRNAGGPQSSLLAPSSYDAQGNNIPTAGSKLIDAIPMYGPWSRNYDNEVHNQGFLPATAGLATDVVAPKVLAAGVDAVSNAPNLIKAPLQEAINTPLGRGDSVTPLERYDAAKDMGVTLDKADATNFQPLNMIRKVNQNSLTGYPQYEALHNANVDALDSYNDKFLNGLTPKGPIEVGNSVQGATKNYVNFLKDDIGDLYDYLSDTHGEHPLDASSFVGKANEILAGNKEYADIATKMQPNSTLAKIQEIADLGKPREPVYDAPSNYAKNPFTGQAYSVKQGTLLPDGVAQPLKQLNNTDPRPLSYNTLHNYRSDLMQLADSPEVIGDKERGWLKQLVGAADDSMMSDSSDLPNHAKDMRAIAGNRWAELKNDFSSPGSMFYHAATTESPSTLYSGINDSRTPEVAQAMSRVFANNPDVINGIRRGVIEKQLKANDGPTNFKTFQGNWNKLNGDYKQTMYTPDQLRTIDNIGSTGNALFRDDNPSMTAKAGQKIAEGSALIGSIPTAAVLAATGNVPAALGAVAIPAGESLVQRELSKYMTNPESTDRMMNWAKSPIANKSLSPFVPPAITAIAANKNRNKK